MPEVSAEPSVAKVVITFLTSGRVVEAEAGSSLLRVSMRSKAGVPFKCGAGLCGTCRCLVVAGVEHTDAVKPRERTHLSDADLAAGYRMACQTLVEGDVTVSWDAPRSAPA